MHAIIIAVNDPCYQPILISLSFRLQIPLTFHACSINPVACREESLFHAELCVALFRLS